MERINALLEQMPLGRRPETIENPPQRPSPSSSADIKPEISAQILMHNVGPFLDRITLERLSRCCRETRQERALLSESTTTWPFTIQEIQFEKAIIKDVAFQGDHVFIFFVELERKRNGLWLHTSLQLQHLKKGPLKCLLLTSNTISRDYDIDDLMAKFSPDCKAVVYTFIGTSFDMNFLNLGTVQNLLKKQPKIRSRFVTSPNHVTTTSFDFSPDLRHLYVGYNSQLQGINIVAQLSTTTLQSLKQGLARHYLNREALSLTCTGQNSILWTGKNQNQARFLEIVVTELSQLAFCFNIQGVMFHSRYGKPIKFAIHPTNPKLVAAICLDNETTLPNGRLEQSQIRLGVMDVSAPETWNPNRAGTILGGRMIASTEESYPGPFMIDIDNETDGLFCAWFPDGEHIALVLKESEDTGEYRLGPGFKDVGYEIVAFQLTRLENYRVLKEAEPKSYPALLCEKATDVLNLMMNNTIDGVNTDLHSINVSPDGKTILLGMGEKFLGFVSL